MKKYSIFLILMVAFASKALTVQEFITTQAIIDSVKIRKTPPDETEKQTMLILKNLMTTRVSGIVEGILAANQMYEVKTGSKLICAGSIDIDRLIDELAMVWDKASTEKRLSISRANLSTFVTVYLEKEYRCPVN